MQVRSTRIVLRGLSGKYHNSLRLLKSQFVYSSKYLYTVLNIGFLLTRQQTCPSRCDEFTPCVQCKVFQTGPYMANNQAKCITECIYPIEVQETVQGNHNML